MKLHTNTIARWEQITDILAKEKAAGRIAGHVTFKVLRAGSSRTHRFGYEIQLQAAYRDNGRRAGNSGSYGAMQPEYDGFAATYDEWGWLINALYELEAGFIAKGQAPSLWGSAKYPVYRNREDFDKKTGMTYNHAKLLPLLQEGYWSSFEGHEDHDAGDPYPFTQGRRGRGRAGAGRITRDEAEMYQDRGWGRVIKHNPRYPLSYAQWAHVEKVSA